jgi:hypothetical protein
VGDTLQTIEALSPVAEGIYFQWTMPDLSTGENVRVFMENTSFVSYGFDFNGVNIYDAFDSITGILATGSYIAGDIFSLYSDGTLIHLQQNGIVLATSPVDLTGAYRAQMGTGGVSSPFTLTNVRYYPTGKSFSSLATQTLLDVKANGTAGGDAVNHIGTYLLRELNTGNPALSVLSFPIFESTTIARLRLDISNGAISIPAGTYLVDVFCPVISVGRHRCRIFDVTNNIVLAVGNNGYSNNGSFNGDNSTLSSVIVIPSVTTIEVQQQVELNGISPPNSLGLANGFGDDEIYTTVRFVKIL